MPLYAFSLFLPSIISEVCFGSCTLHISSWLENLSLVVLVCGYPLLRLTMTMLINYINLRVHGQRIKPSYRPSLCSRLCKYMYGRISSGSLGSEGLFQRVRSDIIKHILTSWFYFTTVGACASVRQYSWFLARISHGIICRRGWLHHPCCLEKRCPLIFCHFYGGMVSFYFAVWSFST